MKKELLGFDILTSDREKVKEQINMICPKMIRDAVEIIEEMLEV